MTNNTTARVRSFQQYIGSPIDPIAFMKAQMENVQKLPYFHSNLTTMEEIKNTLLPYINKEGSFLIRRSLSQQNILTVSVTHQHSIKHFKIQQKYEKFYLQDQSFQSIDDLVKYYGKNDVPNVEGIKDVRLIQPVEFTGYTRLQSDQKLFPVPHSSHPSPPRGSKVLCRKDIPNLDSSALSPAVSDVQGSGGKAQRAPIPLPEEAKKQPSDGIYDGFYYSHIKHEDQLPNLVSQFKLDPSIDMMRCECGLDLSLSELPHSWSVHINREQNSFYGRPFFMSPSDVTSWNLPPEVYSELDHNQEKLINWLMDNYESSHQPPDEEQMKIWNSSLSEG